MWDKRNNHQLSSSRIVRFLQSPTAKLSFYRHSLLIKFGEIITFFSSLFTIFLQHPFLAWKYPLASLSFCAILKENSSETMITTKQKNGEKENKTKGRKCRKILIISYYYHWITFLGMRELLSLRANFNKCKS